MTDALPDPLVSVDVNLRGLPWMPIDTVRLLDSDLNSLSTGDEFKAAVRLWCKAWYQVPAASLPDDDRILATLSGFGARWKKLRDVALRGFMKCSDGRLYHPVIAEKALEAWEHREEFIEKNNNAGARQKRWRERQKQLSGQLRALGVTPPVGASLSELQRLLVDTETSTSSSTGDGREMPLTGTETATGKGQGQRQNHKEPKPSAAARRAGKNGGEKPDTGPTWVAYREAYRERYNGVQPSPNAEDNSHMLAFVQKVPAEDAPHIAAFYVRHNRAWYVENQHPVKSLRNNAVGLRTQWLNQRQVTSSEARQADQTAARGDQARRLINKHGVA